MLCMILGGLGSGKTLLLTIFAYFNKKQTIANFDLKFEHKSVTTLSLRELALNHYSDSCICLDESYIYMDSRNSLKKVNKMLSYILFQSRKKKNEIFITAQLKSSIDIRFRTLCDYIVYCEHKEFDFLYHIYEVKSQKSVTLKLSMRKASIFFQFYDTLQTVSLTDEIDSEYEAIELSTTKEKNESVNNIAEKIIRDFPNESKFSHPFLQKYSFNNGIPLNLEKFIYLELKDKMKNR